ncbi:hypothetical protein QZH41_014026 [Actinostola sp. cb2023]|nr:hypothetical protein QZH41_014026 [Actinostola sp. cb2023]
MMSSSTASSHPPPTLDAIVTWFLRQQHAQCSNPVSVCPPFSLFRYNPDTVALMEFRPLRGIRDTEENSVFTCSCFLPDGNTIVVGTRNGELKAYNVYTGEMMMIYDEYDSDDDNNCDSDGDDNCRDDGDEYDDSDDGNCYSDDDDDDCKMMAVNMMTMILMICNCYSDDDDDDCREDGDEYDSDDDDDDDDSDDVGVHQFLMDYYVRFSNLSEERVIGTDEDQAHMYDTATGQLMLTFADPSSANHYSKNVACFNPTDDLVLNDGVLWDVRSKRVIHKFDKFNNFVSGVFHPSGLEIIINSEIWDVRSFHLLDTCPSLDQCQVVFNNSGDVIYGSK